VKLLFALLFLTAAIAIAAPTGNVSTDPARLQGKSVQQWTEQLKASKFRDQWHAAYVLGTLGPEAAPALPELHKILEKKSEHEYVRGMAAWAIGQIGPAAETEIPLLTETMHSRGHLAVRRSSVEALGNFKAAAKPAVPELVKMLADDDEVTRVNAAVALWKIEQHPKALPALLEMLRHGKPPEPYHAAVALGQMESEAATVAPALLEALQDPDADVRRAAARSLGQLGRAAFPSLGKAKALEDPNPETRRLVIEALGWMGPVAVKPLTEALKDKSPAVRRAAARALGNLNREALPAESATKAETALLAVVNDPQEKEDVRDTAFKARRRIRGE
jgi:HEAT repeat protein